MSDNNGFLVVGADSLVGGGLFRALLGRGHRAMASTRRKDTLDVKRVFLDFESDESFRMPVGLGYAFIVAAATNYERCEKDPLARVINVELIPRLVASLLRQGTFVTFISTNSVFGGACPWPNEEAPHAPGIPYAKQKAAAETVIRADARCLGAEDRLNIVRLTKILDRNTSPLPNWFAAWAQGESVEPFADLTFAPMSVQFVGSALATIGEKRVPGDLHLSGERNVDYVEFATAIAAKFGVDPGLIRPTTSEEKGVHIPFKPSYSGLGMERTTRLTGVKPQTLADVVNDLTMGNK